MTQWFPHVVRKGEHTSGLAFQHGCSVKEIWEYSKNEGLGKKRANADVLQPGDLLWLPEVSLRESHDVQPGETVTVKMAVPKVEVCLYLRDREQKPVSGVKYEVIGISEKPETSGADGKVSFMAPVTTKEAEIRFPESGRNLRVVIGALDPENTISGAISRLNNLEFYDYGSRSDEEEKKYRALCLEAFQKKFEIPVTRAFDETTMKKIAEVGGRDVQGAGAEVTFISPPEVTEDKVDTDPDERIKAYMLAVVDLLPTGKEKVLDALKRIEGADPLPDKLLPLQLLAAWTYCHRAKNKRVNLDEVWSWQAKDLPTRGKQEPAKSLYAEADKAKAAFEKENPEYELHVHKLRSLETQVEMWVRQTPRKPNPVPSVDQAAEHLMAYVRKLLKETFPDEPDAESAQKFEKGLLKWKPEPIPTKAAPGLSDHGRGVAVDFQVFKGKKEITGISTSAPMIAVWMKDGWFEKLKTACSGTRLKGPLEKPYEPWHWWLDGSARSDE